MENTTITKESVTKTAEATFKTFSQLVGIHIDTFTATMINGNRTSYEKKLAAGIALKESILFALDYGISVSGAKIRQGGILAKDVNNLAAILAKAFDTKMIVLASKLEQETTEATASETKGE